MFGFHLTEHAHTIGMQVMVHRFSTMKTWEDSDHPLVVFYYEYGEVHSAPLRLSIMGEATHLYFVDCNATRSLELKYLPSTMASSETLSATTCNRCSDRMGWSSNVIGSS